MDACLNKMEPRKFHSSYKQGDVMHKGMLYPYPECAEGMSLMHTFGYVYYTLCGHSSVVQLLGSSEDLIL